MNKATKSTDTQVADEESDTPKEAFPQETPKEVAFIVVDFEELWKENGDVVGWLYCPDTVINYPVVQGDDNDYYLRRLLDGSNNIAGTLFIDARNKGDFSDWNTVVYGHNMRNDTMFGTLTEYASQEYYCSHVEYESFRTGDILSLVLKYAYFYDGFEGYTAYSYDTTKGVRLTNEDILKMQDMTEADYTDVLRRAAAKNFDDAYHAAWGNFEDIYSGGYQKLRIQTISERNLSLDLPLYLDNGVLHVIAPIGSIAGSEYLSQDLALELGEDSGHVETTQLGDYLTVKRKGDIVTLRVQQTPRLETLLGEDGLINVDTPLYDKDLTVNGLYGSYTKIVCGEIGEADEPFVFLLTKEGRVDCIDILPCLRSGYFCGGGPLLGVANVKDLTQSSADGLPDICAITKSGEQVGLWDTAAFQRYTIPDNLLNCDWSGSWSVSGTEISYSLTLMDGNSENFFLTSYQPEVDAVMSSRGYLTYLGMTEKGAVYAYCLWGEFSNGSGLTGVVAFDQRPEFNGDDYESTLIVTELGGTPFLGEQTGDTTTLAQSFG